MKLPPPNSKIACAFSGSGFLTPIHGGAACRFLDQGNTFGDLTGASGGSIMAAALACGKNRKEIESLSIDTSFRGLLKMDLLSVLDRKGYCNGNALERFLHEIFGDITFSEALVPVTIVSTDLQTGKPFLFNAKNTPNFPLYKACRASAAVPFVYDPYIYEDITMVDAGEVCNFPAQFLSNTYPKVGVVVQDRSKNNLGTLFGRVVANLNNALGADEHTLELLAKAHHTQVYKIVSTKFGFLDTDTTAQDHQQLFELGYSLGGTRV